MRHYRHQCVRWYCPYCWVRGLLTRRWTSLTTRPSHDSTSNITRMLPSLRHIFHVSFVIKPGWVMLRTKWVGCIIAVRGRLTNLMVHFSANIIWGWGGGGCKEEPSVLLDKASWVPYSRYDYLWMVWWLCSQAVWWIGTNIPNKLFVSSPLRSWCGIREPVEETLNARDHWFKYHLPINAQNLWHNTNGLTNNARLRITKFDIKEWLDQKITYKYSPFMHFHSMFLFVSKAVEVMRTLS